MTTPPTFIPEPPVPARRLGHAPSAQSLTATEIERQLTLMLSSERSNLRHTVGELLFRYLALTEERLRALAAERVVSKETNAPLAWGKRLNTYRQQFHFIAEAPPETLVQIERAGLVIAPPQITGARRRVWRLGQVGEMWARQRLAHRPTPDDGESIVDLAHHALCAEAMLRMRDLWRVHPTSAGLVEVRGPGEAAIWQEREENKGAFLVVPDGLMIKYSLEGAYQRAYLVEFHNAPAGDRVDRKVKKYEHIGRADQHWLWQDHWQLPEMPNVLVIYRHEVTLRRYTEVVTALGDAQRCDYLAIALQDIWAGNLAAVRPISFSATTMARLEGQRATITRADQTR